MVNYNCERNIKLAPNPYYTLDNLWKLTIQEYRKLLKSKDYY